LGISSPSRKDTLSLALGARVAAKLLPAPSFLSLFQSPKKLEERPKIDTSHILFFAFALAERKSEKH
jgi:hypothetical protein